MAWFRNLKIRTKLIASFGVVIALVAFMSVFAVIQLLSVDSEYTYLIDYPIASRNELKNFQVEFRNARISANAMTAHSYAAKTSDEEVAAIQARHTEGATSITAAQKALEAYENYIRVNPEYTQAEKDERLALSGVVKDDVEIYRSQVFEPLFQQAESGDYDTALATVSSASALTGEIKANLDGMLVKADDLVSTMNLATTALSNQTTQILIIIAIAVVVISLVLAMAIASIISKPIKRLVEVADNVAHGNLNINIDTSSKDETGMLAGSFSQMVGVINGLVDNLESVSHEINVEGDIDARINANQFTGSYKNVAENINDLAGLLIGNTKELLEWVTANADGDFTHKIKKLPGKMVIINETCDKFNETLVALNKDIVGLANNAVAGNLSHRIDDNAYHGDWAKLSIGLNKLMEAVSDPITEVAEVMQYVSDGVFDHTMSGNYKGDFLTIKNAVNNTVNNIESYIEEIAQVLKNLADNNLNQEIKREYVGKFSDIKNALNNIIDTLNKVIGDMNSASEQVAAGAKQISESSMTLAQGATEQASSVEELTATVMSVNEKTQDNAENSNKASQLSEELKSYAQEGNNQMKDMLKSMQEISEASNSISKIIDIIRDISFQTNLLALNASIEAAHAGVHGAGFSVVAEEVRSLAVKSQEAANNTTELIETSIQRVNEGTDIAVKTDQALEKIVSGVTDVSDIISGISDASNEQAIAISQINDGVGQIAQVVQDNSATSEESAAAAEELSSQSELMRNMVSVFKMKNNMR